MKRPHERDRYERHQGAGGAPIARGWHSATRLNDGRVLVLGGETDGGELVADVLLYE